MTMKDEVEKHNAQPLYRANKCGQVMKRSIMSLNEDGSANSSLGFPVCEVPDYVEPRQETAQLIADLLNKHEEQKKIVADDSDVDCKMRTYRPVEDTTKAREYLSDLCKGNRPSMSIPVQVDDWDMVFSRIIRFAEKAEIKISAKNAYIASLENLLRMIIEISDRNHDVWDEAKALLKGGA